MRAKYLGCKDFVRRRCPKLIWFHSSMSSQAFAWLPSAVDFALIKTWDCSDLHFKSSKVCIKAKLTEASLPGKKAWLPSCSWLCFDKDLRLFNMIMFWFTFQKQQGLYQNKVNCSLTTRQKAWLPSCSWLCFDKDLRLFNMIQFWFTFQKQQGLYQNKVNYSLTTRQTTIGNIQTY